MKNISNDKLDVIFNNMVDITFISGMVSDEIMLWWIHFTTYNRYPLHTSKEFMNTDVILLV